MVWLYITAQNILAWRTSFMLVNKHPSFHPSWIFQINMTGCGKIQDKLRKVVKHSRQMYYPWWNLCLAFFHIAFKFFLFTNQICGSSKYVINACRYRSSTLLSPFQVQIDNQKCKSGNFSSSGCQNKDLLTLLDVLGPT